VAQVGDGGEEGVVAAGRLGAALDDVPGGHGAGDRVKVAIRPAEPGRGRAHDERGVGDPAGHDDVRARPQALRDPECAEIGVGSQRFTQAQLAGPARQVISFDMRHAHRQAKALAQLAEPSGEAAGIEPAGVDDQPHSALRRQPDAVLELGGERPGIAERRVPGLVARQDQHRQLGEVIAGDDVDVPGFQQLAEGRGPVSVEPGGVPDAHDLSGRRSGHAGPVGPIGPVCLPPSAKNNGGGLLLDGGHRVQRALVVEQHVLLAALAA
jgi:hypothetical protein